MQWVGFHQARVSEFLEAPVSEKNKSTSSSRVTCGLLSSVPNKMSRAFFLVGGWDSEFKFNVSLVIYSHCIWSLHCAFTSDIFSALRNLRALWWGSRAAASNLITSQSRTKTATYLNYYRMLSTYSVKYCT